MDFKALEDRIKSKKSNFVDIDGFKFEITPVNQVDMMSIAIRCQKDKSLMLEVEMILASITNFKNITIKDITNDFEEEDKDIEVPFTKFFLYEFLGRNEKIMVPLYEEINKKMTEYHSKHEEQKKT